SARAARARLASLGAGRRFGGPGFRRGARERPFCQKGGPAMSHEGISASFAKRFPNGAQVRVDQLRTSGRAGITVLFGASGAGKTTVLRCLAGLERPDEGTVRYGSELWSDAGDGTFVPPARRRLGFVPQDYALFPHLSVERNIGYGLKELPSSERRARVFETLRWLGLDGLER